MRTCRGWLKTWFEEGDRVLPSRLFIFSVIRVKISVSELSKYFRVRGRYHLTKIRDSDMTHLMFPK